ncbi:hypothetical protein OAP18_01365 [Gammaproteobacteria bacterium]|nr:hypothetical protein [Gammaproteobacteria bacterium]
MNSITDAQRDMRVSYYAGAPGVISSATAWLIAALIALVISPKAGVLTLIFGGMLIFPFATILCKLIGVSGIHSKGNPLAPLAIEGTFWMLISIPVAVGAALYRVEWFFPAMLFVIAGRYLTFSTLYGMRLYWIFAVALFISGWVLLSTSTPAFLGAFTGALIEYCFGLIIFFTYKLEQPYKLLKNDVEDDTA